MCHSAPPGERQLIALKLHSAFSDKLRKARVKSGVAAVEAQVRAVFFGMMLFGNGSAFVLG